MALRARRALIGAALAAFAAVAGGQEPRVAAGTRARFERFLLADDEEAAEHAAALAALDPTELAALARPPYDGRTGARLVRVAGVEPPLGACLVTPNRPPPPTGYPVAVVVTGPFSGPEEFELRARFGALLDAGAALLAPVEPTVWLPRPLAVTPAAGPYGHALVPLLAAAARVAPLDDARRVLYLGRPASYALGFELSDAGRAFAAVHWAASGEPQWCDVAPLRDLGPRRLVLHFGPRAGDVATLAFRDAGRRARAAGWDVLLLPDPLLEHERTARFAAPCAGAALKGLAPNRIPADLAFLHAPTDPARAAPIVFGVYGPEARFRCAGLGSARCVVSVQSLKADTLPLSLVVPRAAVAARDWTRPEAWRNDAPPPDVVSDEGAKIEIAAPSSTIDALWAWRIERRSGAAVASVARVAVRP